MIQTRSSTNCFNKVCCAYLVVFAALVSREVVLEGLRRRGYAAAAKRHTLPTQQPLNRLQSSAPAACALQVITHAFSVREYACGGAYLRPHVADGAHARARQRLNSRAVVPDVNVRMIQESG